VPESFRSELYYLIVQFLSSSSSTSQSAAALKEEIARSGLLQPRYDYMGNAHPKQLGDVANEVGPMPPEYLLDLCFKLCSISQQQHSRSAGATANGIRTLLGHRLLGLASAPSSLESSLVKPSRPGVFHALANRQNGRASYNSSNWHEYMARQMKQLRRTLGHLAAVYCMIFDRTGQIVITGADDFLVKSWRISDGRLVYTFRGAASEISDLAISHDNRLLAAGSCDKVIRVWCLHTAVPITVLCKHTGMITAIHFCPYSEDDSQFYLASTSGDGTVSFWRFYYNEHDVATFDSAPTRYHEKIRPGLSQMICGSFSHGGVFFCVGSADHNVRVYQMNCPEGPQRILEEEAHDDRVDSIQWCNQPDLRFVSGSKDGTARIWSFQRQKWRSIVLNMATGDNKENTALRGKSPSSGAPATSAGDSRNRSASLNPQHHQQQSQPNGNNEKRVTMVAWSLDDSLVITAVSDNTLKLWDSRSGHLRSTLYAHEDEIFVLENVSI
jgi:bromodomain and WD repeat domain-containing protein 1/3